MILSECCGMGVGVGRGAFSSITVHFEMCLADEANSVKYHIPNMVVK